MEDNELLQKLLSIIVPVYNVERYLQECIASMLQGDLAKAEIILVDDGSTDASGTICDDLAAQHECICCIHQENAGVSSARNTGLAAAKGKYVAFVDADDRLSDGSLSAMLHWTREHAADVCFLRGEKCFPDGTRIDFGDAIMGDAIRGRTRLEVFRYLASRPKYPGSACTKLFSRRFLAAKGIQFPAGRTNGEDLAFVMECLLAAGSFDALDVPCYEYRQMRAGSASSVITENTFGQLRQFVDTYAFRLTQNREAVGEIERCAMSFVAYEYLILLLYYESLRKRRSSERARIRTCLRERQWVLQYAGNRSGKLGRCCMRMLGFDLTAWLIGRLKA